MFIAAWYQMYFQDLNIQNVSSKEKEMVAASCRGFVLVP